MLYDDILEESKGLSEQKQGEVLDFIMYLKSKGTPVTQDKNKPKRKLGGLEGKLNYIADDFDETPDCFKEYV